MLLLLGEKAGMREDARLTFLSEPHPAAETFIGSFTVKVAPSFG